MPDELLEFLFILRLKHPTDSDPVDPERPPSILLSFLKHTQITYDASYISSLSRAPAAPVRLNAPPPRTTGLKLRSHVPPNIVPPATPNPMPATADSDRRYMRAEGMQLTSGVWGEVDKDEPSFVLVWDPHSEVWTAVFRLNIAIGALCTLFLFLNKCGLGECGGGCDCRE
jgi:hypothetical protein